MSSDTFDTFESRRRFVAGVGGPGSGTATTPTASKRGRDVAAANDAGPRPDTRRAPVVAGAAAPGDGRHPRGPKKGPRGGKR